MAQIKSLSTFLFLVLIFFHEIDSIEGRRLVTFGIENQLPKSSSLRAFRELVEHKISKLHGDDHTSSVTINADDANAITPPTAPALPALSPPTAPPVPALTPPTPGRVESFRPTTPGHSPGVGHSIQN